MQERGTATVSRGRALVVAAALELTVSLALLLFASTNPPEQLPAWGGPLDVAVAAAILVMAAAIWARAQQHVDLASLRVTHIVAAMVPALTLAALWFYREGLDFNVLPREPIRL